MLQLLPSPSENIVAVNFSGSITKTDYDQIIPIIEARILQHGKLKLYAEVEELEMLSLRALWQDLKFDIKHYRDFTHVAVVGEMAGLEMLIKAAAPFVPAEVKVFSREQKEAAMNWLAS